MWLTTITPPSYSYVSFCSRFRLQMSLYTHLPFLWIKNKCVVAAGIFNHLLRFPLIWPLLINSYSSQLPYYLHHWTLSWLKEVRGSDLQITLTLHEGMEVLRRSSVFAAEVLDVFDRSLTEKELVTQSKALCRDYILSRLNQNGLGWSKTELNFSPSNAALAEVSMVLLCLGKHSSFHKCHLIDDLWTMIALFEFASFWTDCFIISAVMKIGLDIYK